MDFNRFDSNTLHIHEKIGKLCLENVCVEEMGHQRKTIKPQLKKTKVSQRNIQKKKNTAVRKKKAQSNFHS